MTQTALCLQGSPPPAPWVPEEFKPAELIENKLHSPSQINITAHGGALGKAGKQSDTHLAHWKRSQAEYMPASCCQENGRAVCSKRLMVL